jgi:hypothetical protein
VETGLDRASLYLTNTVKHFKFERHGKQRLLKRPTSREIRACVPWFEAEWGHIPVKRSPTDPSMRIAKRSTALLSPRSISLTCRQIWRASYLGGNCQQACWLGWVSISPFNLAVLASVCWPLRWSTAKKRARLLHSSRSFLIAWTNKPNASISDSISQNCLAIPCVYICHSSRSKHSLKTIKPSLSLHHLLGIRSL